MKILAICEVFYLPFFIVTEFPRQLGERGGAFAKETLVPTTLSLDGTGEGASGWKQARWAAPRRRRGLCERRVNGSLLEL